MNWPFRLWVATGLVLLPYVADAQKVGPNQNSFVMGNATGGNQGYGTINAEGLFVNGVSVGSGGGGCTNNCTFTGTTTTSGINDITPATSTGFSTTGALVFGGTVPASGSGVVSGSVLNNLVSYDYPTTYTIRNRNLIDTVTANSNSTEIDEGMFLGRQYSGTATLSGEINGYHSFFADAVGLTFTGPVEQYEASNTLNVAHQQVVSYLALNHVTTTGSIVGDIDGLVTGLTNDNTTAGSIFQYTGIQCKSMSGAGAQPTHSYCLDNGDTNQMMIQAGNTVIGKNAVPSATVTAEIFGANTLNSSFALAVVNSTPANLLIVRNSGEVDISTGSLVLGTITGSTQCLQASTTGVVSGTGSACGSGGGGVSSVANSDGTLTISPTTGSVVASLNLANPNTWTAKQIVVGTDNLNSTKAFVVTNLAGSEEFSVTNAGTVNAPIGLFTGTAGSVTGKLVVTNATAGSASIQLNAPIGSVLTSAIIVIPDASGTLAEINVNQTFTGTQTFSGTLNASGTFQIGGVSVLPNLSGTTGSIGGGALLAGACTSGTVAVTGSTTSMAVDASPVTYPGDGSYWMGYVSTAGTVTVKLCATVALTPGASAYNVRVLQ